MHEIMHVLGKHTKQLERSRIDLDTSIVFFDQVFIMNNRARIAMRT